MRNRRSLLLVLLIVLCATIIVGSTTAYFTDQVPTDTKVLTSGDLEVSFAWANDLNNTWQEAEAGPVYNQTHWEPNFTAVRYFQVKNTGDMAFQYELNVLPTLVPEDGANLMDVIDVYCGVVDDATPAVNSTNYSTVLQKVGNLSALLKNDHGAAYGIVLPKNVTGTLPAGVTAYDEQVTFCVALHMQHTAGNEYMGLSVGEGFDVQLVATQYTYEADAFGNLFANDAQLPKVEYATSKTIAVTPDANGCVPYEIRFVSETGVTAIVPQGAKMEQGATQLILIVYPKAKSDANLTLSENEQVKAWEVEVEGLADDNTLPVRFTLPEAMQKGLNIGNYSLYHVENGTSVPMTRVEEITASSAHNSFTYNPATGDMGLALATFSEVAIVSNEENAWNGEFDYTWYTNAVMPLDGETVAEYTIANADQLAAFGAIVGGMNGQTQNSFAGKTVKLISDINLGDKESENNPDIIFYPIGYYNSEKSYKKASGGSVTSSVNSFEGTFDGNGHTVKNFYQNTWEMFGDYNDGYSDTPNHYKDAMGLFGYVVNGTIKNLTVDHFSSDGEFTPTGVIAAYAVNSTFENIAITNCNPRVYNTGNGGIVGIGGNSDDPDAYKLTFTNITIDNTNTISALWGSWDVACGGLVGMFRGAGHVHMTNCHVAAQMDVNNDVCGNYQYYWYRYSGMMVGTNKNMITDEAGYTVPETDKFHAENCTVHFGDWNDYYYCELVANSLASYTHDHQFSRLTEISSLDEIKSGDTWTKAGNFLLISDDTKTCYHIVKNGEGTLTQHLHTDAGEETVNGKTVLKEDKQIVYLPFNQLFTGYGYGVKHIPVYNGEKYAFEGIEILDRPVANSHKKFMKAETAKEEYVTGTTVKIGDLFGAAVIDSKANLQIKPENVKVFVSPVGDDSTADGVHNIVTQTGWEEDTLTFYGKGKATVTITDYYFCEPCTITVEIKDTDILYRVGNQNAVTYAQIAKLLTKKESYSSIDIENYEGEVEFTETDTYVQFTGTGLVKVEINGAQYFLEVVDAKNITVKADATANNVVLLNDISGGFTVSNGYAFYGNGFKVTCSGDGSYRSAAVSYGFVTVENGGILDNVQIICDIFPESYLYTIEMKAGSDGRYPYGYSAVVISGNSTISNSYIYGARNNIQVGEGDVIIKNTVTECGSLSNIHIKSNASYTVTLEDVTTIQYQTTSNYDSSKKVLGFGVLVGTNESETNAKIELKGDFRQYNWVIDSDTNVSNSYAKTAISEALKVTAYQHTINGKNTVNMGIVYLNSLDATIVDTRDNKNAIPYALNNITMSGQTGKVYSIVGSDITADARYDAYTDKVIPYTPNKNEPIMPSLKYEEFNNAIVTTYEYTDETWQGKVAVDLDNIDGGSYDFMFSKLTVLKYGKELEFTVKDSDGSTVDKNTDITLNQLVTHEYALVVTDDQTYDAHGALTGEKIMREIPFVLNATKTSIEPPKFTNAGTATAIRLVEKSGGDWRPAYTVLTGVTVTYWSASESKVKTVDLSTLYNSGTINSNVWTYTCDDYTLTITGGAVHSDGTTITPVVANSTLYFASMNKAFGTGTTSRNIILTYVFTDKNASTTWNRTEKVTYSDLSEYDYNSFKNGTLKEPSSGGNNCVTPDTLVTLADGTQVRVDSLTGSEKLLVWNMEEGRLDEAGILFVDRDPEAEFEIVHLYFSDGTDVKVIYEHGFWDYDLNRYVYLDKDAAQYIGHSFFKLNGNGGEKVQLTDVVIEKEVTTAWSPVTENHLCYFVNGMLSMPGGVGGLFNIFDVDADTMMYDMEALAKDIETYGLFTYEELNGIVELPEEMFNAAGGAYLKISIGKGNLTMDELIYMINRYKPFF